MKKVYLFNMGPREIHCEVGDLEASAAKEHVGVHEEDKFDGDYIEVGKDRFFNTKDGNVEIWKDGKLESSLDMKDWTETEMDLWFIFCMAGQPPTFGEVEKVLAGSATQGTFLDSKQ